eukprot:365477-Chlamydomonas_euryale.AAC.7
MHTAGVVTIKAGARPKPPHQVAIYLARIVSRAERLACTGTGMQDEQGMLFSTCSTSKSSPAEWHDMQSLKSRTCMRTFRAALVAVDTACHWVASEGAGVVCGGIAAGLLGTARPLLRMPNIRQMPDYIMAQQMIYAIGWYPCPLHYCRRQLGSRHVHSRSLCTERQQTSYMHSHEPHFQPTSQQ